MLKPSELRLAGTEMTITAYMSALDRGIGSVSNKKMIKTLNQILKTKNGGNVDIDGLSSLDINEIKNYFAESIGPYLIYRDNLLKDFKLAQSDKCFFPISQTEGMYDFSVSKNDQIVLISNKQLKGGTNTLKPIDVLNLVSNNPILKKKWSNKKEYKAFEILDKNNVISGPMLAIKELFPNKSPVSTSDITRIAAQMNKNDVVISNPPSSLMRMIKEDKATSDKLMESGFVSGTMVNFLFEKLLIAESKTNTKFNELFVDVTMGNIQFLKFDISSRGMLSYMIAAPGHAKKPAILRSKQGVERRSSSGSLKLDKLGFQP